MIALVVQLVTPKLGTSSNPFHLHTVRGVDHFERKRIESALADEVLERIAPEDDSAPMLAQPEHQYVHLGNSEGAGAEIVARREQLVPLNSAGAR